MTFFEKPCNRVLGSLSLLMLIIALGSYAMLNFSKIDYVNPTPATITVSGEGEVFAIPDIAEFSYSVYAEADTAAEARDASAADANAILEYLKAQGVEEKDIKTESYSLSPRYEWEERACEFGSYCPPANRVQAGFTVNQRVMVKLRGDNTEKAGEFIAGVEEVGATSVGQVQFTVDDTDALQAEARAAAITDAQQKAEVLAAQLGVRLGEIVSFSEGGGGYYASRAMMAMDAAVEESAMISPELPMGEESISSNVSLTFELK